MKKMKFLSALMAATVVAMSMVACDPDDKTKDDPINDDPATEINALVGSVKGVKELNANTVYTITGPVIIEEGGTLDIPAGTVIEAEKGFGSYILVLQGGKIFARGTADKPVVMTADIDNAEAGYWGGLIINGNAPINDGKVGTTEINSAYSYGGDLSNDSSGSITYLVLEYTGARSSADVEHNGLTLNGVGSGTVIENVFIPEGSDDGIEFFGGTVNVKNLLVVNSDDDMFDFTQGYSGKLTNAYGIWEKGFTSSEADPRGVEADGNLDGLYPDSDPQSNFAIENVTFDLRLDYVVTGAADFATKAMQDVLKIRRGAKATVTNALVKGTGHVQDLVDFTDGAGNGDTGSSVSLTNSLTEPATGTNPDRTVNPASGYSVTLDPATANTGCATGIFDWTGYEF